MGKLFQKRQTVSALAVFPHKFLFNMILYNAPTPESENRTKYIKSRGYRCSYLSSYSPNLNPVEQF